MNPVQSPAGHRRTTAVDRGLMFEMLSSTALWVPARSATDPGKALVQALIEVDEVHIHQPNLRDATCPICLRSLAEIIERKDAIVQLDHNNGCSHMFCRKDIIKWLEAENTTCPTCRSGLVDPNAVEEKGHFLIFGGSHRLVELYERQGIRAKLAPSQTEPGAELDEVCDRLRRL